MASFVGTLSSSFLQSRLASPTHFPSKPPIGGGPFLKRPLAALLTNSTEDPIIVLDNDDISNKKEKQKKKKHLLACPICYEPLASDSKHDLDLSLETVSGSTLRCGACKKSYFGNQTHFELTAAGGAKSYGDSMPASTELFRTPLVSFLYERGWRQSFSIAMGYPGPEEEFKMIRKFVEPVLGGNIVDASCGSGMFSRLFATSGLFSHVVALDYSENMLKQCYGFIQQEQNFPKENISLVRADISRLPFVSGSIDAVHAGAALHCWPSPLGGVAEISRVLRPGGVFVATTQILDGPFAFVPFLRDIRQNVSRGSGSYVFLSEHELEDLCKACGLVGFTIERNRGFVMISVTKPT